MLLVLVFQKITVRLQALGASGRRNGQCSGQGQLSDGTLGERGRERSYKNRSWAQGCSWAPLPGGSWQEADEETEDVVDRWQAQTPTGLPGTGAQVAQCILDKGASVASFPTGVQRHSSPCVCECPGIHWIEPVLSFKAKAAAPCDEQTRLLPSSCGLGQRGHQQRGSHAWNARSNPSGPLRPAPTGAPSGRLLPALDPGHPGAPSV